MAKSNKSIVMFALTAFVLLGVLFGMQIMTFVFGNLGPSQAGLTEGTQEYNTSLNIQNNSLQAINNYSTQAGTQFNTIGIAITVAVLILLFMMFWNFFMKGNMGGSGGSSGGNFG